MDIPEILKSCRCVAVLGARDRASRAGFYVGEYLASAGYEVVGVNPRLAGSELWGRPVVATLADIEGPIDLVDVFRRSEDVPSHLEEILALDPLPKVVWLQLGIRNEAVAQALRAQGIVVVQDRCTLAEHRRLGL